MVVRLIRPVTARDQRLFHRTQYAVQRGKVGGHYRGPIYIPPKVNSEKGLFRLLDPDNVLAIVRLYRWFLAEEARNEARGDGDFSGLIEKDDLMKQCFSDSLTVGKTRVGRLLRLIVQYETNFQQNPSKLNGGRTVMNWRWCNSAEMIYGLEYLLALFLPQVVESDGGSCSTTEEFEEELEILRSQSQEDDLEFIRVIVERRLR